MKPLIFIAAFAALLISCSKPSQENEGAATADSTDVNADPNAGTAQGEIYQKPLQLTGDDLERFKARLFMALHEREVYPGKQLIISEDFQYSEDGSIQYKVVSYNRTHTRYDEEGVRIIEEGEPTKQVYNGDPDPATFVTAAENDPVNEADTIIYDITKLTVYDISRPESNTKKLKCLFRGSRSWINPMTMSVYGYTMEAPPTNEEIKPIEIDLADPLFTRDQMYFKAKVMALSDDDLNGMSKEQLGYLRNEIFARHGHTFKTPKMKNYFTKQDWYFEAVDDALPYLNELEKQNIDFIKKREG